jgi:hypothetical protein
MIKNLSVKLMAIFAISLIAGAMGIFAQGTVTGGIIGKVSDPQGAVVPNVTITVTNIATNAAVTTTSTDEGTYRVSNLQPGTYRVETTATGFAPAKAENIIVEVGRSTTVDIPLTIGGASAIVDVPSEAPVINTNDNTNSNNFNQTAINELPINGRRWSNFAVLSPSAVPDGTFGLISFRGISGLLNNNTIDGGDNNQAFFSEERGRTRINYSISQAAIREFQVNTSNYSAEFGRSAGGVTNAVTKSGTNEFHGDLFYYQRNNRWGARNPLATLQISPTQIIGIKPIDVRHQFGGTIGGPIIKDKLFFFFSYDQQKRNFPGLGRFSSTTFLNAVNNTLLLGKGFTQSQIDGGVNFLLSLTGTVPRKGDQTLILPKIDWVINKNNTFSINYNRLRWDSPNGIQTQATSTRGRDNFGDDFVDGDTVNARLQTNISANILNEARFQWGRDFEYEFSSAPAPGAPLTAENGTRTPDVFITNGLEFGTPTFLERPKFPDERRLQFADTLTWSYGRHTFKFGGDYNRVTDDIANLRFEAGSYSYNNVNDFLVDFLNWRNPVPTATCATQPSGLSFMIPAGRCWTSDFQQGIGSPGIKFHTNEYNFFAQDDFRVSPRFTLNVGLRWEYIQMPSAPLPNQNTTGTVTANTIIPFDSRTVGEATSSLPSDKDNFGPRIGFAYDITGDAKNVIRGGFGIYYGRIQNSTIYNALVNTGNPGGQAQRRVTRLLGSGSSATLNPNAPVFPNILPESALSFQGGAIQFFERNFQAPLIYQYDVVYERQIMRNTVVSASYVGSKGYNLPTFFDLNFRRNGTTAPFTVSGGPFAGATFTLPLYTRAIGTASENIAMTQIRSSVRSWYNALVLQANRRFTHGIQFQASYTFAKSTDTNQNSATFTQTNSPYDILDRSFDKGPSNFDVRHKIVVNAVIAPKFYKGKDNSVKGYFMNGWSFAPIATYYSGRPFDGTVSGTSLNGTNGDNRFPLNPRNAYRLPAVFNVDARLSKRFAFNETMRLELLAEAFNVFNRTQVFGENSTLYNRSGQALSFNTRFGEVTGTDSTLYRERQVQLAARFQF